MQSLGLDDVNPAPEELLQLHQKRAYVQQAAPWLHFDQQIDIAVGTAVATRDRAEQADSPGSMLRGDPKYFLPLGL
jgi:hypothetical protein